MIRSPFLVFALISICLIVIQVETSAQNSKDLLSPEIHGALDKGLNWLASRQNENGSWTCRIGQKLYEEYIGENGENVGVTALAGLALLIDGSLHEQERYGKELSKAIDFLLKHARPEDGYITYQGTRMYEHAFATRFLAEYYGIKKRDDVKKVLEEAVKLIERAQNADGGWRYEPKPIDADISVTATVFHALLAARKVRVAIPQIILDRAVKYIKASSGDNGDFGYQIGPMVVRGSFSLTACGVSSLQCFGDDKCPEVRKGLERLAGTLKQSKMYYGRLQYLYGQYFASQALYRAGSKHWDSYWSSIGREILDAQNMDGHWVDAVGPSYATAMACIIIETPLTAKNYINNK